MDEGMVGGLPWSGQGEPTPELLAAWVAEGPQGHEGVGGEPTPGLLAAWVAEDSKGCVG